MDIIGMWKIAEVNVMDENFKQTWKNAEQVAADDSIHPMQKTMAQCVYLFEADGTLKQLMPKELAGGEGEPYDDKYVVGHVCGWKEEDGKLMVEGDDGWEEAPATADGFEVFSFFRIVKA